MENIKINYSKEYIKELVAECVFFLACMILSFFIALFSRKNTDNQQINDFAITVAVLIVALIVLYAITTLRCQKFCVTVTGSTIYISKLFSENEFLFSDITKIRCSVRKIPRGFFKTEKKLDATLYFGKKKLKLNSDMNNCVKFLRLLAAKGYLKKDDVDICY